MRNLNHPERAESVIKDAPTQGVSQDITRRIGTTRGAAFAALLAIISSGHINQGCENGNECVDTDETFVGGSGGFGGCQNAYPPCTDGVSVDDDDSAEGDDDDITLSNDDDTIGDDDDTVGDDDDTVGDDDDTIGDDDDTVNFAECDLTITEVPGAGELIFSVDTPGHFSVTNYDVPATTDTLSSTGSAEWYIMFGGPEGPVGDGGNALAVDLELNCDSPISGATVTIVEPENGSYGANTGQYDYNDVQNETDPQNLQDDPRFTLNMGSTQTVIAQPSANAGEALFIEIEN